MRYFDGRGAQGEEAQDENGCAQASREAQDALGSHLRDRGRARHYYPGGEAEAGGEVKAIFGPRLFDRFRQVLCAVVLIFCTGKLTACANPRRNHRRHFPPFR